MSDGLIAALVYIFLVPPMCYFWIALIWVLSQDLQDWRERRRK